MCFNCLFKVKNFLFFIFIFKFFIRKRGKAFSIVERETAPLLSNKEIYLEKENLSLIGIFNLIINKKKVNILLGPLSIATPGELLAYRKAYEEFGGGVSWSTLFNPTIRLCEKGFNVSHALAYAIKKNKKFIINDKQLRFNFFIYFLENIFKFLYFV